MPEADRLLLFVLATLTLNVTPGPDMLYVIGLWCKRYCWLIISAMRQLSPALLYGRHSDRSIIILGVRWYVTYKLSYRDLVEMMAERGVAVSQTTILRGDPTLRACVREALEPLCPTRRHFLARGRGVRQGQGAVDFPLPRCQ